MNYEERMAHGEKPARKKRPEVGKRNKNKSRTAGVRRNQEPTVAMMTKGWRSFCKERAKERVYISGKITGEPDYAVIFRAGEMSLYRRGWRHGNVVNPVKACKPGWSWLRCMARCLMLVAKCDAIALLPNWKESRGAKIEYAAARLLGKRVYDLKRYTEARVY